MLTRTQAEKLEIVEKLLEELVEDESIKCLDIPVDVTLVDSLQGIKEVLDAYYPDNYTPPKPIKHIRIAHPWHEKLKVQALTTLGDITGLLVIIGALSACASLTFWGISDIKDSLGHRQQPDFAKVSEVYRGLAIASMGAALGCGVVGSAIVNKGE